MTFAVIELNSTIDVNHAPAYLHEDYELSSTILTLLKFIVLLIIMSSAVLGNSLVIIGVVRFHKLRSVANSFLVSLAFADLLVAVFVMPFSASQEISGRWLFPTVYCDIFNANDVLFSTASLLHLCCISVDRYVYITNPFHYATVMSRRRAALMITTVWVSASTLSHIPIYFRWHTASEEDQPYDYSTESSGDRLCSFKVNPVYGVLSSAVSFWLPACVMLATYVQLYREATKQADLISKCYPSNCYYRTDEDHCRGKKEHSSWVRVGNNSIVQDERRPAKKAHKAARTLGMIVGAFLVCWMPFFTWYLATTMCSEACYTPPIVSSILFWIGYLNSAINPVIYAFFNRDFREAFGRLLGCFCRHVGSTTNSETIVLRSDANDHHVACRGTML